MRHFCSKPLRSYELSPGRARGQWFATPRLGRAIDRSARPVDTVNYERKGLLCSAYNGFGVLRSRFFAPIRGVRP